MLVSTDAVIVRVSVSLEGCAGLSDLRSVGSDLTVECSGVALVVFRSRQYAILAEGVDGSDRKVVKFARHGLSGSEADASETLLKCLRAGRDLELILSRKRLLPASAAVREGRAINDEVPDVRRAFFRWDGKRRLSNRDVNPFAGFSPTEPYATLGRVSAADRQRARENLKRRRHRRRKSRGLLHRVLRLLNEGWSVREVAKETGVPRSTVGGIRKRFVGDKSKLLESLAGDEEWHAWEPTPEPQPTAKKRRPPKRS